MNILLDYIFKVSSITPTPAASTAFLKQVALVCKPNGGGTAGNVTACTSSTTVAAVTDNTEADRLFAAGMAKVYIIQNDDLDLADILDEHGSKFFTVLISSDFDDEDVGPVDVAEVKSYLKVEDILYTSKLTGTDGDDIAITYNDNRDDGGAVVTVTVHAIVVDMEANVTTATTIANAIAASSAANALVSATVDVGDGAVAQHGHTIANLANGVDEVIGEGLIDVGTFKGVIGLQSQDEEFAGSYAVTENYSAWLSNTANKAKNMCYAFGKLLSNALNWANQQYISMPLSDDIETFGDAETLFDEKISFVITDDQYANRLALFAVGGKAIVAPYITRNLQIDLQSAALSFISGNQPAYTKKNATLLENELKDVIQSYIDRQWIEAGTVEVKLEQDNFVASGFINIAEPKALWRVFAEMRQTL
jgi:hypothetical protein